MTATPMAMTSSVTTTRLSSLPPSVDLGQSVQLNATMVLEPYLGDGQLSSESIARWESVTARYMEDSLLLAVPNLLHQVALTVLGRSISAAKNKLVMDFVIVYTPTYFPGIQQKVPAFIIDAWNTTNGDVKYVQSLQATGDPQFSNVTTVVVSVHGFGKQVTISPMPSQSPTSNRILSVFPAVMMLEPYSGDGSLTVDTISLWQSATSNYTAASILSAEPSLQQVTVSVVGQSISTSNYRLVIGFNVQYWTSPYDGAVPALIATAWDSASQDAQYIQALQTTQDPTFNGITTVTVNVVGVDTAPSYRSSLAPSTEPSTDPTSRPSTQVPSLSPTNVVFFASLRAPSSTPTSEVPTRVPISPSMSPSMTETNVYVPAVMFLQPYSGNGNLSENTISQWENVTVSQIMNQTSFALLPAPDKHQISLSILKRSTGISQGKLVIGFDLVIESLPWALQKENASSFLMGAFQTSYDQSQYLNHLRHTIAHKGLDGVQSVMVVYLNGFNWNQTYSNIVSSSPTPSPTASHWTTGAAWDGSEKPNFATTTTTSTIHQNNTRTTNNGPTHHSTIASSSHRRLMDNRLSWIIVWVMILQWTVH